MDTVGLSAILADSKSDYGTNPDDDAGGDELEHTEPNALDLH